MRLGDPIRPLEFKGAEVLFRPRSAHERIQVGVGLGRASAEALGQGEMQAVWSYPAFTDGWFLGLMGV